MSSRLLVLALIVAACGPTAKHHGDAGNNGDGANGDGNGLPHTLTSLVVSPTNPIVELDLNQTGTQDFTVTAGYADGTTDDVTSQVTWSVMNPAVGTMSGATLQIPSFNTSTAQVSLLGATYSGITGNAQVTVVAYRKTGPATDFFFVLPYQDPMGQMTKPLDFATNIPALDVFFLMDTTASMTGEISNLQNALIGTVIPGIQNSVANSQFGVGALEDFPYNNYGAAPCTYGDGTNDQPFKLRQTVTSNTTAVAAAINGLTIGSGANKKTIGCGSDIPEAGLEAIYQAATGEGFTGPGASSVAANHTGIGGVAFRQGTMPVIVDISDAVTHGPGEANNCGTSVAYASTVTTAHDRTATKTALSNICARVVGISADSGNGAGCSASEYMRDLATYTGARVPPAAWDVGMRPLTCASNQCCTGANGAGVAPDAQGLCPVVFDVAGDGTGVSSNIVTGLQMLTRFATFNVPTDKQGVGTDIYGNAIAGGHTTDEFIKAVTPTGFVKPPPPPVLPDPTFDATQFYGVTPGTHVDFAVNAYNDFVMQTQQAQIFRATIRVLAGGCTPLDQRDVLILVPPTPITIQ